MKTALENTQQNDNSTMSNPKNNKKPIFILTLPNYTSWNILILILVILDFFITTLCFTILESDVFNYAPFFIIFDIVYIFNLTLLLLHRFWKELSTKLQETIKTSSPTLVLDLVSILPQVTVLLLYLRPDYKHIVLYSRLVTVLRLHNLSYLKKIQERLLKHRWTYCLMQSFVYFLVALHSVIIAWFIITRSSFCTTVNVPKKKDKEIVGFNTTESFTKYFFATYISLDALSNTGFGNYNISTHCEMFWFIITTLLGYFLSISFTVTVCWLVINKKYLSVMYQQNVSYVEKYLENLPTRTKGLFKGYHEHLWKNYHGTLNSSLLNSLPLALQLDIAFDVNCGLIHRSLLLKNLPLQVQRRIALAMKIVLLQPKQPLYYKGVIKKYMVCIERGLLEVFYDDDDHNPATYFADGAVLSEISLFLNESSQATVRAVRYTELRVLERVDFMRVMLQYPEELRAVRNAFENRIEEMVRSKSDKKVACQNLKIQKVKLYEDYEEEYSSMYKLSKEFNLELPKGVVFENSVLMKIWFLILSTIQIVYCLWYPYYLVFERHIPYDLYIFGLIADILCFVDIVLQCTTPITIKKCKTVQKILEIIDTKLNQYSFYCDVFSLFPIESWAYAIETPAERHRKYDLLKLNRLLRIWHIKTLFGKQNSNAIHTMKTITYACIFTYFIACFLYLNACPSLMCHEESWYHQKIILDLQRNKDIEYDDSTFPTSLYFAVMSVFHTGLGDVLPKSGKDITRVMGIIILFMLLKIYWISQLVTCMFLKECCSKTYQSFFYLKTILNWIQLPNETKRRLKKYIMFGSYFPGQLGSKFIQKTTSKLLQDELQILIVQNVLANLPMFKTADSYFLAVLEKEVQTFFLQENEALYCYGDRARQMYVLQKGYCNLYTTGFVFQKCVGPGAMFGSIEMLSGGGKRHTAITTTDCVVSCLEYASLARILSLFPKEQEAFKEVLESRWFVKVKEKLEQLEDDKQSLSVVYRKPRINAVMRTNWKKLWKIYKAKLGVFWFLGFLLMPFTINPNSIFIKFWCGLRCILIIITSLTLPLIIMVPPFANSLNWLVLINQCSLYFDMFVLLHVSYYDSTKNLVTNPMCTAWHYITHSFVMDLVAALPLVQIFSYMDPPYSHYHKWRLLHLVQLHRVFKYFSYLKNNSRDPSRATWEKLMKWFIVMVLLVHILAALMLSVVCNFESDRGTIKCQNGFWLNESIFTNISSLPKLYLVGIYGVVNFFTATGLQNITGQSWLPMIGIVMTIIIGFICFSSLCAIVVAKMLQRVSIRMDFRKQVELFMLFLRENSLPTNIQDKVFNHFEFIWGRNRGNNYTKIIHGLNLSLPLSQDVFFSKFQECLKQCALFHSLDNNSLKLILKLIGLRHYKKGEIIISYKDVIQDMFILVSGEVEILNENHYYLDTLGVGGTFGNVHNNVHSCSLVYVQARRNVDLCVIPTSKLLETLKYYPHVLSKIQNILNLNLKYIEPHNLYVQASTEDNNKESDFWNEIESDEELPPKTKSSLDLINPLVVLKPQHQIFQITTFLVFTASCLNMIFIPYVFVTQDQTWVCYLYLVLEPIFYVKIYMKLRQAYYNFYGNIIKSKRKIFQNYFNNPIKVIWDVMSNIPLSLACFAFKKEEWFFFYSCLRLLHILRMYYILEYFKVQQEKLQLKVWLPMVKMCTIYFIIIHFISCFWLMMACPFNSCHPNTWISQKKDLLYGPPLSKMLLSYHYVISTITGTGVGDILPKNLFEMTVTLVIMVVGKILTAILLGTILWTVYCSKFDLVKYEFEAGVLEKYLQDMDLSSYQVKRVQSYLQNLWKYERGKSFPQLLHKLPYVLTCDIMTFLYGQHLRQNVLFKKIDEALLRQICSKLKRYIFFHYDYIVRSGDVNSSMYFIQRGTVTVLTKHEGLKETHHVTLQPNDMFGICQGFGQGTPHHFTYRASSNLVEILVLQFEDWSYLLEHFPRDRDVIFRRIEREYVTV